MQALGCRGCSAARLLQGGKRGCRGHGAVFGRNKAIGAHTCRNLVVREQGLAHGAYIVTGLWHRACCSRICFGCDGKVARCHFTGSIAGGLGSGLVCGLGSGLVCGLVCGLGSGFGSGHIAVAHAPIGCCFGVAGVIMLPFWAVDGRLGVTYVQACTVFVVRCSGIVDGFESTVL